MAYNKTLHEIISSPYWLMDEVAFNHYKEVVLGNIEARIPLAQLLVEGKAENGIIGFTNKGRRVYCGLGSDATVPNASPLGFTATATVPSASATVPSAFPEGSVTLLNSACEGEDSFLEENEEVVKTVLVLHADGPITRGGDGCSYGSLDHRQLMLDAAEDADCMGVLFHVNTPGGNAECLPDYKMGFSALREAGKRSIALVDGKADSLGIVITSQCDYTLCVNGDCILGCIGSMMSGRIAPDGAINTIDGERNITIVATQSPDKNRAIREAANGDYTLIQKECDDACQDFLDIIDTCRPQILPEHRTGNTYKASTVIGSLCDGIGTEADCLAYLVDGVAPVATTTVPSASPEGSPVPSASPEGACNNPKKQHTTMNIQNICNALGIPAEDMHTEENGFFLNEAHADALDAALATANEALATANARIAELEANDQSEALATANARIAELEANDQSEALATANARIAELEANDQSEALATANARIVELEQAAETASTDHASAIEALNTEHASALDTANARIAELEAQNEELSHATTPAAKPAPSAAPAVQSQANEKKTYAQCDTLDEKKAHSIYA